MNIPIEEIIQKYGSRKSLSAIVGMAAIVTLQMPEMLEPSIAAYLSGAKIAGITILGVMAILAQWKLDSKDDKECDTCPNVEDEPITE